MARKDNDGRYRVGWWSDSIRDEAGNVRTVTAGMTTTLEAANRDLVARIAEGQERIKQAIGPELWASLDENQKTALDSIVYNYGTLPDRITKAIKAGGGRASVAQAIADLGTDNGGINAKRRQMEANLFGGGDFSAGAKTATQSFKEMLDEANRATAVLSAQGNAMTAVAATANDYGYSVAYATKQQQLLNQAQAEGLTITPAMSQQIDQAAASFARATQEINKQKAATQESARAARENAQQWEQFGNAIANTAQSALSGFVNDLRNGVSAGDAFRNMLNRIVDGLINMAIQSLFSKNALGSLFSGFGGGGGFDLGAGIVGIAHTGGVAGQQSVRRWVNPAVFAGAPRYHSGGVAGLRPGEVPAILQRGELIIPRMQAANQNAGMGTNNVSVAVNANGALGSTTDAKQLGELVQAGVERILVKEQRPGGLLNRRRG